MTAQLSLPLPSQRRATRPEPLYLWRAVVVLRKAKPPHTVYRGGGRVHLLDGRRVGAGQIVALAARKAAS